METSSILISIGVAIVLFILYFYFYQKDKKMVPEEIKIDTPSVAAPGSTTEALLVYGGLLGAPLLAMVMIIASSWADNRWSYQRQMRVMRELEEAYAYHSPSERLHHSSLSRARLRRSLRVLSAFPERRRA